ncbi:AfsR/SARP family transcriptional regulator [Actinoplanes philippinensis]|uniref:AfsR/SARP family transcriptional regulator n=1 Tax=Actinoplanes philippinensis TaxID=35752 RepID=UPI00340D999D
MTVSSTGPHVPVDLRILGPLQVLRDNREVDAGPRQQRCLLGLLLVRAGQPVSMTELIEMIWGSGPPATAINVIHKYVGAVRRLFEPGLPPRAASAYLTRHGNGYRLSAGPENHDLVRFRRLLAEAGSAAARDEPDEALDRYVAALRLGRGRSGDGLADTPAARAAFAAVDREFTDAVLAASTVAVRLNRPSVVLGPLRQASEMDPYNEQVHAGLMRTLAVAGHHGESVAVYRATGRRLAEDLGVEPGPEMREAYRQVMGRTMVGARPVPRPAQLPRGLPSCDGRSAELAELTGLAAGLRDGRRTGPLVIALDGRRGTGKSALAVQFAHRVSDGFTDGQIYLDLRGDRAGDEVVTVRHALRSLLRGLGLPSPTLPATIDAQVGVYRSLTAGKRILILLDNVRDADQVRPLLPSSPRSLTLLTSRRPLLDVAARQGAHLVHVGVLDSRAARALLQSRITGRPRDVANIALLDEIADLCGRLPLALAYTAAQLTASPDLPLAVVAAQLRQAARRPPRSRTGRSTVHARRTDDRSPHERPFTPGRTSRGSEPARPGTGRSASGRCGTGGC